MTDHDSLHDREHAAETIYASNHDAAASHLMHDAGFALAHAIALRDHGVLDRVLMQREALASRGELYGADGHLAGKLDLVALGFSAKEIETRIPDPAVPVRTVPVRSAAESARLAHLDAALARFRASRGPLDHADRDPATRGAPGP